MFPVARPAIGQKEEMQTSLVVSEASSARFAYLAQNVCILFCSLVDLFFQFKPRDLLEDPTNK